MKTERTSLFLMANLASEVSRILSSRENRDETFEFDSLKRADRIISDIKKLPDMSNRKHEIETIAQAIREPRIEPEDMRSYFDPFVSRFVATQS